MLLLQISGGLTDQLMPLYSHDAHLERPPVEECSHSFILHSGHSSRKYMAVDSCCWMRMPGLVSHKSKKKHVVSRV